MGRKIPGKKHHGVKDPEKQRQRREDKVKAKINAPPKDLDGQEMPKKMLRMMRLKEDVEKRKVERRLNRMAMTKDDKDKEREDKDKDRNLLDSSKHMGYETRLPGMKRPLKPVPVFKQNPGESDKKFLNRVEVTCKQVLKRREYEDKYGVDITDDPESGGTSIRDREKDEVDLEVEKKKKAKVLAKKGIVLRSKEEKRAERRLKEKEKRLKKKRRAGKKFREECAREGNEEAEEREFDEDKDKIAFNDVVQAPPMLRQKPRGASDRKTKKKDFLFQEKMRRRQDGVSLAKKHMMEEERLRVVKAYRDFKKAGNVGKVKI